MNVANQDIVKSRKRYVKLKLGLLDKLKYSLCSFLLSKSEKRKKKVFNKGLGKIENSLDIRALIRN